MYCESPNVASLRGFVCVSAEVPRWKRIVDITLILLASPILVPLLCSVAALIKIVSRGPLFFTQERIGYLGKPFVLLKFRTMIPGAATTPHKEYLEELMRDPSRPMEKLDTKGDSRLIRFGGFLRSTGLDELPQLLNVLKGEMSLVGPRPCTAYEFEQYAPWHRRRVHAVPGLTGLWQVNGKNRTTFQRMIELDLEYVRTQSVKLDLQIMLKTVPALVRQVSDLLESRRLRARAADKSNEPQSPVGAGH